MIGELVNAKNRSIGIKAVMEYRAYYGYMSDDLRAYEYLLLTA